MEKTIPKTIIRELLSNRVKKHLAMMDEGGPVGDPIYLIIGAQRAEIQWVAEQLDIELDIEETKGNIYEKLTWYQFDLKQRLKGAKDQ